MNIVYGVSGEGLGHVFEALQIVVRLKEEGHAVKVLTYGDRAFDSLAAFGPTRIEGIHLQFDEDGMSLTETFSKNLRCIPFFAANWGRLSAELEAFRPDVFITAYEPFTMVASHVMGVPLVSMDNQNELLHVSPPPGIDMFAFRLVQLATCLCTFGARDYIVKSFDKPEGAVAGVHFVAPVIQRDIRALRASDGNHVLVYLTKPNAALIEVLRTIDETFIVYCHNHVGEEGNITHRAKGPSFLADLGACKAIIGTTGFSLIADAIFLKKPYFGVPLRKQFEQTYNAHYLAAAGFGAYSEAASRPELESFFANLPRYRAKLARHTLDPSEQEETLLRVLQSIDRQNASRSRVL
ncbi:MAG TPA: glycosyltransferase family protein [Opitutaceae bacterium]